jgi:uncharacterized integral membrane protein
MTDESHDPFGFEQEPGPDAVEQRSQDTQQQPPPSTAGIAWGAILLLVGIALVVIFAVQNNDIVPVRFLWMEGEFSMAIVILVVVGAVILLSELIGLSYRRRRRRRRSDQEELRRLRGGS